SPEGITYAIETDKECVEYCKENCLNFGNDLYSERTQIINLLHGDVHGNTPWVILQKKYSDLKKIIFNITYENRQECVYFYGYDKDWNIIWKRKRILKTDRDSIITNKKQILKNLI
ncbi:MAG: hypothetical protein ACPGTS_00495, partial [Minisyncoccia bacterium]